MLKMEVHVLDLVPLKNITIVEFAPIVWLYAPLVPVLRFVKVAWDPFTLIIIVMLTVELVSQDTIVMVFLENVKNVLVYVLPARISQYAPIATVLPTN